MVIYSLRGHMDTIYCMIIALVQSTHMYCECNLLSNKDPVLYVT